MGTPQAAPAAEVVLGKSLFKTAEFLEIGDTELGAIIGRDRSSISRLRKQPSIPPNSKTGELALLFIRVYRSLFAILGGNQKAMIAWLNTENHELQTTPLKAIKSVMGISQTVEYLDAMRGKI